MCRFTRNDYEPDIFFDQIKVKILHLIKTLFLFLILLLKYYQLVPEYRDRGIKKDDYEAHGVKNIDQILTKILLNNTF